MAKKKEVQDVEGRALVDIPDVAKCGEFVVLPIEIAKQFEEVGAFDPLAKKA